MHDSDDNALDALSCFLVALEDKGLTVFEEKMECDENLVPAVREALVVLGKREEKDQYAELIMESVVAAFDHLIERFQAELCSTPAASPQRIKTSFAAIHYQFAHVSPILAHWSHLLKTHSLNSVLLACIRCKLVPRSFWPRGASLPKKKLFSFLTQYWEQLLSQVEQCGASAELMKDDEVLQTLHSLRMSETPEIQRLLMSVVVQRIHAEVDTVEDDYSVYLLQQCLAWEDRVVEPFLGAALRCPDLSSETCWRVSIQHTLRNAFFKKRLGALWDILVDFPESVPALEDLRSCIQLNSDGTLRTALVGAVRTLFAQRLHRVGARTEDIVEVLIKAVYSLCVIFSRSEQSTVFSTIGDTLAHIGRRKDCASAVIQCLHQMSSYALRESRRDSDAGLDDGDGARREGPDFFRVLASVIPVGDMVQGYRDMLATQLLSKSIGDYDTTTEDEMYERLKRSIGERILSNCMVMLRDISVSRRLSQRLHALPNPNSPDSSLTSSLLVLSRMAWPEKLQSVRDEPVVAPPSFRPHAKFQVEMERLAATFRVVIPNQKLCWNLSLGRVNLKLHQKNPERNNEVEVVPFTVSLFGASVLLLLQELSASSGSPSNGVSIHSLASALAVDAKQLEGCLHPLIPKMIVRVKDAFFVQTTLQLANCESFEEMKDEEEPSPSALTPDQLNQLKKLSIALLRSAGKKTINEVHNSLKQFASFECSLPVVRGVLKELVDEGKIALDDGNYTFKKK